MELRGGIGGLTAGPRGCRRLSGTRIRNTLNVVPAQAGTHTPQRFGSITLDEVILQRPKPGILGPRLRGDDVEGI